MKQGDRKLRALFDRVVKEKVLITQLDIPDLELSLRIKLVRDWRSTKADERPKVAKGCRLVACASYGEMNRNGTLFYFTCATVSLVDMLRTERTWDGFLAVLAHEYSHSADSMARELRFRRRFKNPTRDRLGEFRAQYVETYTRMFSAWQKKSGFGKWNQSKRWRLPHMMDFWEYVRPRAK